MTPSELKYHVKKTKPFFFSHKTMKFFGDTMKNYGCRSAGDCWELWRKHPVKHKLKDSAYFDKKTFERIFKEDN